MSDATSIQPAANEPVKTPSKQPSLAGEYARKGWSVFPLYGFKKVGQCACEAGRECIQPGKHSRTQRGVPDASNDLETIKRWWSKWSAANIGIVTGQASGIIAIRVDLKDGGAKELHNLERELGTLPKTATLLLADHEQILVFRYPQFPIGIDTIRKTLSNGVTVVADGDFIVAPRSRDVSGQRWEWGHGCDPECDTAQLPAEWAARLKKEGVAGLVLKRAADIKPVSINAIWNGRFPIGSISILSGDSGVGTSLVGAFMAATISNGGEWPSGEGRADGGHVILIAAKDSVAEIIRPRLQAAGADLTRVHLIDRVQENSYSPPRNFSIKADLDRLGKAIGCFQTPRLIIIDPLNACFGSVEGAWYDNEDPKSVQEMFDGLEALARTHRTAAVCIVQVPKARSRSAPTRVFGTFGFTAAARAVLTISRDPADPAHRILFREKNDIGQDEKALGFRMRTASLEGGIVTTAIEWDRDPIKLSPDQSAGLRGERHSATTTDAMEFLKQTITSSTPSKKVFELGHEGGFSPKELRTAANVLGIVPKRVGGVGAKGNWCWQPGSTSSKPSKPTKNRRKRGDA